MKKLLQFACPRAISSTGNSAASGIQSFKVRSAMVYLAGFRSLQRNLWLLFLRAPWIPLAAILGEAIQHAVEVRFGMYVAGDGIAPGAETWIRAVAAAIKVVGFIATLAMTSPYFRPAERSALANDPGQATALQPSIPVAMAAVALPVVAHYALNFAAVGMPVFTVIVLLLIDVGVIGWLSMSVGASLHPLRGR